MAGRRIIFEDGPGERRAAFFDADKLREIWLEPIAEPDETGAIMAGRMRAHRPELRGGFVDIGAASAAFLQATPGQPLPPEGAMVMVQLRRPAAAGKGPRVSQAIALNAPGLCLSHSATEVAVARSIGGPARRRQLRDLLAPLRPADGGWRVTAAAADLENNTLATVARELVAAWQQLKTSFAATDSVCQLRPAPDFQARLMAHAAGAAIERDHTGQLFEKSGAEAGLAAALDRQVRLSGGAMLVFDQVEALTAIDVDAASAGVHASALDINLQAAAVIAAEIRLRALGGMIVIDFLRLHHAKAREQVKAALLAGLDLDPAGCEVLGWTRGGLFELRRRRLGPSLQEQLYDPGATPQPKPKAAAHALLREVLRAPAGASGAALLCSPEIAHYLGTAPGQAALAMVTGRMGEAVEIKIIDNKANQPAQVIWRHQA